MSYTTHHSFSVELASIYGIEEAILIHHFQHWIKINRRLKRNIYEERTWTYQTQTEISANFPYLSTKKVFRIIQNLEEKGVILKGNFNKTSMDRTIWYAFVDEESFLGQECVSNNFTDIPKKENGFSETVRAIPDTIPDTKTKKDPPLPPPSDEKEKVRNKLKKKISFEEKEFEEAFRKMKKSDEIIYSPADWLKSAIENARLQGKKESKEERIKRHKLQAKSMEIVDGLFRIDALSKHVEFIRGNAQPKCVPYDLSEDKWKEQTGW